MQETVHKAEEAASQAAQESIRHGHKAETRVSAAKEAKHSSASESSTTDHAFKHVKKHHSLHGGEFSSRGVLSYSLAGALPPGLRKSYPLLE